MIVDKNILKKMFSKSEKYTFRFNTEEEMDEFIRLVIYNSRGFIYYMLNKYNIKLLTQFLSKFKIY